MTRPDDGEGSATHDVPAATREPTTVNSPVEAAPEAAGEPAGSAKAERKRAKAARKAAKAEHKAAKAAQKTAKRKAARERRATEKAAERAAAAEKRAARTARKAARAGRTAVPVEAPLPAAGAAPEAPVIESPALAGPAKGAQGGARAKDGSARARKVAGRAGLIGASAAGSVLREVAGLVRQATEPAAARIVGRVGQRSGAGGLAEPASASAEGATTSVGARAGEAVSGATGAVEPAVIDRAPEPMEPEAVGPEAAPEVFEAAAVEPEAVEAVPEAVPEVVEAEPVPEVAEPEPEPEQEPEAAAAAVEPEHQPAAVEPEPQAAEPEPALAPPPVGPEAVEPEPAPAPEVVEAPTIEPEPDLVEPEPEPQAAGPELAGPEAAPEAVEPEPQETEPEAVEPEPEIVEPELADPEAEPAAVEPEPGAVDAVAESPEPVTEPVAAAPQRLDASPLSTRARVTEPPALTPLRDTIFLRDVPPGAVVGASIDVGSNSVHLLVGIVDGHRVDPVVDESVFLGLGDKVSTDGFLGVQLLRALVADLARYVAIAKGLGARTVTIIGTEPIRRADDAAAAVHEVTRRVGVPLHVLDHDEEGLLTLLGVTGGRRIVGELLVVDIGGGSSELVSVTASGEIHATGLQVGSARLTRSLARSDPPSLADLEAMRVEVARIVATAPVGRPTDIVAVGGTSSNLLRLLPATAIDRALTRRRIAVALAMLTVERSREAAVRHRLRPERARVLPAGAIIVDALLEHYGADRLRVSEEGIREGAVLAATTAGASWRDRLRTLAAGWDEPAPGA